MEFKSFNSIERLESPVTIWEKLDGTNSQVVITEDNQFLVGSRNRWITPEDDNYGFAQWAYSNREALTNILGVGSHFGEWYGAGIQRKYGMSEKRFALFNPRHAEKIPEFIPRMEMCPVLYTGLYKEGLVEEVLAKLKSGGSVAAPGFMNPEGIVIYFHRAHVLFKKVFEDAVPVKREPKEQGPAIDVSPYLQKSRLESVLSKDERLVSNYPDTLVEITQLYAADLIKETYEPIEEATLKAVKKNLFKWIKENM